MDKEFRTAREQVNFENEENLEEKKIDEIISYEISNITDGMEKIESLKMLKDLVANFDILQKDKVLTVIDEKVNSLREVENHPKNIYSNSEPKVIKQHFVTEKEIRAPGTRMDMSENMGRFRWKALKNPDTRYYGGRGDENSALSFSNDDLSGGAPKDSINKLIQPTEPVQEDKPKEELIPLVPTFDQDDEDVDIVTSTTTTTIIPTVTDAEAEAEAETTKQPKKSWRSWLHKLCKVWIDHPPLADIKMTVVLPSSIKRKRETDEEEEYCACDELETFLFGGE